MNRLHYLMTEGIKVPGTNGYRMDEKPDWYDSELYRKGRNAIRRYNAGVLMSSTLGPIILSQYEHLVEPLVMTGNLKTPEAAKNRVANTYMHALKWIDGDMFNPKDPAYQSLLQVRGIHHRVAKKLQQVAPNRKDGGVWLSQFEMAITMFSITGPTFIYPQELGIYATEDELEAVAFVWKVVARQMGMMDEFNLCQGTYQEIKNLCLDIVEIAKPTLMNPKEEYTLLLKNSLAALKDFSFFIDYACLLNWTYRLVGLEKRLPLSWYGHMCERAIQHNIKMMRVGIIRDIFTPWYKSKVTSWVGDYQKKSKRNGDASGAISNRNAFCEIDRKSIRSP